MTLRNFIRQNRAELDAAINKAVNHVPATASCYCPLSGTEHDHEGKTLNDQERRLWILNDEGLYRWARSSGVQI